MSAVAAILEGARKAVEIIRAAEPFMTSGGRVRLRTILLELGELIADEIERERFGRSSTEPAGRTTSDKPPQSGGGA